MLRKDINTKTDKEINMNMISNVIHTLTKSAARSEQPRSAQPAATRKLHRTSIEDLSPVGYELSEEHLRLVSGGMRSAGTCCDPGMCDDDQ